MGEIILESSKLKNPDPWVRQEKQSLGRTLLCAQTPSNLS